MARKARAALVVLFIAGCAALLATCSTRRAQALEREAIACRDQVQSQVRDVALTPSERRWEGIGWIYDVDQALDLARQHHRPVLVYTLDGHLDGRS